jgi:hypothetical protein
VVEKKGSHTYTRQKQLKETSMNGKRKAHVVAWQKKQKMGGDKFNKIIKQ